MAYLQRQKRHGYNQAEIVLLMSAGKPSIREYSSDEGYAPGTLLYPNGQPIPPRAVFPPVEPAKCSLTNTWDPDNNYGPEAWWGYRDPKATLATLQYMQNMPPTIVKRDPPLIPMYPSHMVQSAPVPVAGQLCGVRPPVTQGCQRFENTAPVATF